ncbi:PHLOEM PROTEIN 2-LIKE A3 [Biomphalaria pfeifferi]|uniref:PHLOEM PROTEIN 2-LIKE A3 n=1 Tax=Biomphalaria pfeifferi TaxID=112525 RepID=A0AAD8B113_BIOPF|nr:PHLOEM PROTEIN 2-LIKE A3 [Biomphalaria pfeifferi]
MSVKKEDLTILLIGKVGSGTSTVEGRLDDNFDSTVDVSEALIFEKRFKEDNQCRLHIFKAPGIWDIDKLETYDGSKKMYDDMLRLMEHVNDRHGKGITAFLLVMNINERFKQEDKKLISTFEMIFGEEHFWRRCIIVFTGGDHLEGDFDDWVVNQTGEFEAVIKKCDKRLVLIKKGESFPPLLKEIIDIKIVKPKNYTLKEYLQLHERRCIPRNEEIPTARKTRIFPGDYFWNRLQDLQKVPNRSTSAQGKWEYAQKLALFKHDVKASFGTFPDDIRQHISDLESNLLNEFKEGTCKIL